MAPRKKKLPFGFEEDEQYVSIVLKHRLRDNSASSLNKLARTVNFVWNYCNETRGTPSRSVGRGKTSDCPAIRWKISPRGVLRN
jgi:hypothetical protein